MSILSVGVLSIWASCRLAPSTTMTPASQESLLLLLAMVVVLATGVAPDVIVDGEFRKFRQA